MLWDNEYKSNKRVWGEGPSELAIAAVRYLQKYKSHNEMLNILDIGCGYGRDAFYFWDKLGCRILGIDSSKKAIDIASNTILEAQRKDVKFHCCNFMELEQGSYDIVFISNLYHLFKQDKRKELRNAILRTLKQDGILFLSTLSVSDPEHSGKGIPVSGESNSFQDRVYLHLCTREELLEDFAFLDIEKLYEHEYYEPRATGEIHHHISWILIGQRACA